MYLSFTRSDILISFDFNLILVGFGLVWFSVGRVQFEGEEHIVEVVESTLQIALTQIRHFGPGDDLETQRLEHIDDEARRLALHGRCIDGEHFLRLVIAAHLHVGLEGPDQGQQDQTVGFQSVVDLPQQAFGFGAPVQKVQGADDVVLAFCVAPSVNVFHPVSMHEQYD